LSKPKLDTLEKNLKFIIETVNNFKKPKDLEIDKTWFYTLTEDIKFSEKE